jgi:penicillin amidase
MKTFVKLLAAALVLLLVGSAWYLHSKQPMRDGSLNLNGLQQSVTVRYDERGVPHINAQNEPDLYRALGYVHAQDRLFQMEMVRRLAMGELAEILGPSCSTPTACFALWASASMRSG